MITNVGKNIIGRYLVGTAPAYASYIAVGCGATPLKDVEDLENYSMQQALDFEMFRVPITSRGFVEENGQTKVVFSAEVPTTERYEITEIGIYSAASNPSVIGYDSRTLYAFTREEDWKFQEQLIYTQDAPLDSDDPSNDIAAGYFQNHPVIQTYATNKLFREARIERSEQSRYLNNMVMLASNFSDLSGEGNSEWNIEGLRRISLATSINLSKNSPNDEIRLALSVVDVNGDSANVAPNRVRVVLEFTTESGNDSFRIDFQSEVGDFDNTPGISSRYKVLKKTIGDGEATTNFLWSNVNNINIYAAAVDAEGNIIEDEESFPLYYIALDAIRLENLTANPLYGLTGYTVIVNPDPSNLYARPIVKLPNTSAIVEFRLGVGIQPETEEES